MAAYEQLVQELKLWYSFPSDSPTVAEIEQILGDVLALTSADQPLTESQLARIVKARIPSVRFIRRDGMDFQDMSALLAILRAQAKEKAGPKAK